MDTNELSYLATKICNRSFFGEKGSYTVCMYTRSVLNGVRFVLPSKLSNLIITKVNPDSLIKSNDLNNQISDGADKKRP